MATFSLTDDGTLDTVVRCDACGVELRYNFDSEGYDPDTEPQEAYDNFVEWACADAAEEHECECDRLVALQVARNRADRVAYHGDPADIIAACRWLELGKAIARRDRVRRQRERNV